MSSGRKSMPPPANRSAAAATATSTASASAAPSRTPDISPVRIKQEPGTSASASATGHPKTERLPSYREQRDLTLGGLAPGRSSRSSVKKVFVPNLNVARNKNADVLTSRDTSASSGRGGRGAGRGGDRSKSNSTRTPKPSTLVQTSGLFSEGTGEAKLRKSSSVFDRNAGAGDSASQLRRPTLVKREQKVDANAERQRIQEVLGTMMDDEATEAEDRAYGTTGGADTGSAESDGFAPIALVDPRSAPAIGGAGNRLRYPETLEEMFEKVEQQLFVLQLPDTLPGHGPDVEPAESAEAEAQAAERAEKSPLANFCTARQLEDGRIGRIVRRRSGKIQMILGDLVFNLSVGIDPGMLQEVMSVQTTDPHGRHGTLNNLGQIGAKLNVTPDWLRLFEARAAEARRPATVHPATSNGGDYGLS